jgi:hypothetical protein
MKLPSYRRILKTDYAQEYQSLVDKLAVSINYGFDTLYEALNKRLTFQDNFSSTIATFNVAVDDTGKPLQLTQFRLNSPQTTVQGIIVLNCYGYNNSNDLPSSGVFVSFSRNENIVNINYIKGLQPNIQYVINVLALS